jgi:RNase P subunit RPR2
MDRVIPDKHSGKRHRDIKQVFCPKCASELRLMINVLDTRVGKSSRLFRCECGEFVWGD